MKRNSKREASVADFRGGGSVAEKGGTRETVHVFMKGREINWKGREVWCVPAEILGCPCKPLESMG